MSVTYYVALPFVRTEDGVAPGEAQEMPNEGAAIRRAEAIRTWEFRRRHHLENVRRGVGEFGRAVNVRTTIAYAAANLRVGRSISHSTITALTTFQIRPLKNATR